VLVLVVHILAHLVPKLYPYAVAGGERVSDNQPERRCRELSPGPFGYLLMDVFGGSAACSMADAKRKSFEELALPHLDLVYRVARRLTHNSHEAEDLVQETYLKACRAFDRFELRAYGVRPWLLKILNNAFLNRAARESRAPRATDQQALDETQASDTLFAPPELDYENLDEEVKQAIEALSPDFRAVLLLWATMELSYQEIADILDVPIGTVMSRLHRARQQLHAALASFARQQRLAATERES
jgi:RNA polymerase sigma-70 factor (ECF subfamily)